jgi:hypothetical protein
MGITTQASSDRPQRFDNRYFARRVHTTPNPESNDLHMNTSSRLDLKEVLRIELAVLKREHGDLDEAIDAIQAKPMPDALRLQRMKRQKLSLKDRIAQIEDQITPDIIA